MEKRSGRITTRQRFTGAGVALAIVGMVSAGAVAGVDAKGSHGGMMSGHGGHGCIRVLVGANRFNTAIDDLVTKGTLNAAQATAVKSALNDSAGPGVKACEGVALVRESGVAKAVGTLLGMDAKAIEKAFAGGKSLSEIAQAKGVDRQKLVETITTAIGGRLDEFVKTGKITTERKSQIMMELAPRIDKLVDLHASDLPKRQPKVGATPAAPAATPVTSAVGATL